MASIRIEVFRGKKGLYEIKDEWDSIVKNLKHKHIFHLYQWHKSYIETLKDNDSDVYYVLMYRDNTPFAIFPLEKSLKKIFGLEVRILQIPHCSDSDLGDFIYEKKERNEDVIKLLVDSLEKFLGLRWNCIVLPNVFGDSSIYYSLQNSNYSLVLIEKGSEHYYFNQKSYDEINENLSKNLKNNLKKARKKLASLGDVEVLSIKNKKDLAWAFQEFMDLEASGWKAEKGEPIKKVWDTKKFYERLIQHLSESDGCEISLLRVNDKFIGGVLCLQTNDTVYGEKIAYDEDYSKVSPGTILADDFIKRYTNDDSVKTIHVYDAKWMAKWKPLSFDVFNIVLFNKSLIGLLCYKLLNTTSVMKTYERIGGLKKKYKHYVINIMKKSKKIHLSQ